MNTVGFKKRVISRARQMKEARSRTGKAWLGLGLVGALGWVVVLPMVGGVFLGRWLDRQFDQGLTFTLLLLLLGLATGIYSVWRFFLKETI